MIPTRPLGSPRHALDSFTFRLHTWKPFKLRSTPQHIDLLYTFPSKKPRRADCSTSICDTLDFAKLSLLDEFSFDHQHAQSQLYRVGEEGISGLFASKRRRHRRRRRSGGSRRTHSSGEFFMNVDWNWGPDASEVRFSGRDSSGGGVGWLEKEAVTAAPCHSGLGTPELQAKDSGYASEAGYGGDAEFEYGDKLDEEENGGEQFEGSDGGNKLFEQKVRQRYRRKKHCCPVFDNPR